MIEPMATIEAIRAYFKKSTESASGPEYSQIYDRSSSDENDDIASIPALVAPDTRTTRIKSFEEPLPFSWFEFSIFLLLGITMLWAW